MNLRPRTSSIRDKCNAKSTRAPCSWPLRFALFVGLAAPCSSPGALIFQWNAGNDWYNTSACGVGGSQSNWVVGCGGNVFPSISDDVVIPLSGPMTAVTMASGNTHFCNSLTTDAGTSLETTFGATLFIQSASSIAGDWTLRSVTVAHSTPGIVPLSISGNLLIAKLGLVDANVSIAGFNVMQSGPAMWTGSSIATSSGTQWFNTSTFEATGNNLWNTPNVTNTGMFTKHTGTGTTELRLGSFSNSGTVNANSGTLILGGNGASISTGEFNAASGVTIEFHTHTFDPPARLNGAGLHRFAFGTQAINGVLPVNNIEFDNAAGSGTLRAGPGDLRVSGAMRWVRGVARGTGSATILPGATLTFAGVQPGLIDIQDGHQILISAGAACDWLSGDVRFSNDSQFTNSGGVNVACDRSMTACSSGRFRFHNQGAFVKNSPGTTTMSCVDFDNDGTVTLPYFAGPGERTLLFSGSADGHSTGEWKIHDGCRLALRHNTNFTFHFDSAPAADGPFPNLTGPSGPRNGMVEMTGKVSINTPTTIPNLDLLAGGQVLGSSNLAINTKLLWRNGIVGGSGSFSILDPVECSIEQSATVNGRRIVSGAVPSVARPLAGVVQVADASMTLGLGASIDNSGYWELRGDGDFLSAGFPNTPFNNLESGLLRKSTGTSSSIFTVDLLNIGDIVVESGRIRPTAGFTQTTGSITVRAGAFFERSGLSLNIGSGRLMGDGTVIATGAPGVVNSEGVVAPGLSPGQLSITGSYAQGAGGTLEIDVEGPNPVEHDRLAITGAATLGGTLRVLVPLGVSPGVPQSMTVLTAASVTGTFSAFEQPAGRDYCMRIVYTPTSVRVETFCVADVDDGTETGTPDGGITFEDFLYYLRIFDMGEPRADLDDGSDTCTMDGGVTFDDLIFFLRHFDLGC